MLLFVFTFINLADVFLEIVFGHKYHIDMVVKVV